MILDARLSSSRCSGESSGEDGEALMMRVRASWRVIADDSMRQTTNNNPLSSVSDSWLWLHRFWGRWCYATVSALVEDLPRPEYRHCPGEQRRDTRCRLMAVLFLPRGGLAWWPMYDEARNMKISARRHDSEDEQERSTRLNLSLEIVGLISHRSGPSKARRAWQDPTMSYLQLHQFNSCRKARKALLASSFDLFPQDADRKT